MVITSGHLLSTILPTINHWLKLSSQSIANGYSFKNQWLIQKIKGLVI